MAYSFLIMLSSTSVWMVRNQSLFEMWWLFTSLMRYPREIFRGPWAGPVGWFFSFVVPVLLVTNVPAATMVESSRPGPGRLHGGGDGRAAGGESVVLPRALRSYRSASS